MKTPRRRLNFKTPTRNRTEKNLKLDSDKPIKKAIKSRDKTKSPRAVKKTVEKKKKVEKNEINEPEEINDKQDEIAEQNNIINKNNIDKYNLLDEYKEILYTIKNLQDELIESYKKENECLREMKKDVLLYKKFLGLDIKESDDGYLCTYEIESKGIKKILKFLLVEEEDVYEYKLIDNKNVELPDYLANDIWFNTSQLNDFFFSVMKVVIAKIV